MTAPAVVDVQALRAAARNSAADDAQLGDLAALYYARVGPGEIGPDPQEALAIVRAHRSLARLRVPGRPVTAVLGAGAEPAPGLAAPDPERVSVLVVTEDMPFLIDSVVAELSRTGATVHRHYDPGSWVPHVSVATGATGAQLPVVTTAIADVLPLEVVADRAVLVDSSTGQTWELPVIP